MRPLRAVEDSMRSTIGTQRGSKSLEARSGERQHAGYSKNYKKLLWSFDAGLAHEEAHAQSRRLDSAAA
eukprot:scaffold7251_cov43-Attheya_sp.AAC.5